MAAVLVALLAVVGCKVKTQPSTGDGRHVATFQDEARGVTCWLYGSTNGGISCLPNWMITKPLVSESRPCVGHRICAGLPELQP